MYLNSPICDWDPFNKRYRPYATIARVDDYGALGPNPPEIGTDIVPTDAQIQVEQTNFKFNRLEALE